MIILFDSILQPKKIINIFQLFAMLFNKYCGILG